MDGALFQKPGSFTLCPQIVAVKPACQGILLDAVRQRAKVPSQCSFAARNSRIIACPCCPVTSARDQAKALF